MKIYKITLKQNIRFQSYSQGEENINSSNSLLTFGQFDSVSIEKRNLNTTDFNELYSKNRLENNNLIQTFFVYSKEDDNFIENGEEKFRYRFITFSYYNDYYFLQYPIDNNCYNNDTCVFKTYNTLNNVAFISIFYSNNYEDGKNKVYEMTQNNKQISNFHYTILSINERAKVKGNEYICVEFNLSIRDADEFNVHFKSMEQYLFNNNMVKKTDIHTKSMFGNKDFRIHIDLIEIVDFLKLYKEYFQNGFNSLIPSTYSVSTYFMENYDWKLIDLKENNLKIDSKNSIQTTVLSNQLIIDNKNDDLDINDLRNFIDLIKNYFILKPALISFYPSLRRIIDKIKDGTINSTLLEKYCNDAYVIARSMIDSSLRTLHDPIVEPINHVIPEKVINFYTCYLYDLKDYLLTIENSKINYHFDFLIKPTRSKSIAVVPMDMIDNNPKERMLLIKIPIKEMFNFDLIVFEITHELMHYVGQKQRNREKRLEIFCDYLAYTMTIIVNKNEFNKDDRKKIKAYMCDIINSFKIRLSYQINGQNKNEKFYLYDLKKMIIDISNFIENNLIKINENLQTIIQNNDISFVENLVSMYSANDHYNSLRFVAKDFEYICRECYADLMAINITKCPVDKYIEYFFKNTNGNNRLETLVCYRIALVLNNVYTKEEICWNNIIELFDNETIICIRKIYLGLQNGKIPQNIQEMRGIRSWKSVKLFNCYLQTCNKNYSECAKSTKYAELFRTFLNDDISEKIDKMQQVVICYYQNLLNKNNIE